MTTDVAELGLRERKRRATRRAIQLAVLDLVAQRGLENVTVDEISRIADVSPRTFFNYFTSKEEALIGESPTLPDEAQIERFVTAGAGSDLLSGLGEMISRAGANIAGDVELVKRRRELMKQHPQLFALRMATMRSFEEDLGAIVSRRLLADEPALAQDPADLEQRSRLITLVAMAAMRHAWTSWADSGGGLVDLSERLRSSFAQLGTLLVQSAAE
jgi:AcrR family transcriptional regulator